MSSQPPTTTPTKMVETAALFLSTLSAGVSLSFSVLVTPRLLESPTPLMLQQWRRTYRTGAATMPLAALACGAGYAWLAAGSGSAGSLLLGARGPRARLLFAAAGALTAGIVPYTLVLMLPLNKRLIAKGEELEAAEAKVSGEVVVEEAEERSAKGMVDWWGVLNLGRAAMMIAGSACGFAATVWGL